MKKIMLVLLLSYSVVAKAQLEKGTKLISTELSFYNRNVNADSKLYNTTPQDDKNTNKNFDYSVTLTYSHFIKTNLALVGGLYIEQNKMSSNLNSASYESYYERNSKIIGAKIGIEKYISLSNNKLFLVTSILASGGILDNSSENRHESGNPLTNLWKNKTTEKGDGFTTSALGSLKLFYKANNHWAFSSGINLININYQKSTNTSTSFSESTNNGVITPSSSKQESNQEAITTRFIGQTPINITFGITYLF